MRHNVTTPGGFFVGLGGIVAFCVVSGLVFFWVKSPRKNVELHPQQTALGLAAAPDADKKTREAKDAETEQLLKAAGAKYNGGQKPDIDKLSDLRGVLRYREAQKSAKDSADKLNAASNVAGKTVFELAMEEVAKEIVAKKPAPSTVALLELVPDPKQLAPTLPNYGGGGARTVNFADPNKPATPPAPAAPAAPAPGAKPPAAAPSPAASPAVPPAASATPPTAPAPAAPAPNRPPLLNSPAPK